MARQHTEHTQHSSTTNPIVAATNAPSSRFVPQMPSSSSSGSTSLGCGVVSPGPPGTTGGTVTPVPPLPGSGMAEGRTLMAVQVEKWLVFTLLWPVTRSTYPPWTCQRARVVLKKESTTRLPLLCSTAAVVRSTGIASSTSSSNTRSGRQSMTIETGEVLSFSSSATSTRTL
eukprot:278698-Rhodomonas_salina.2